MVHGFSGKADAIVAHFEGGQPVRDVKPGPDEIRLGVARDISECLLQDPEDRGGVLGGRIELPRGLLPKGF